MSAEPLVTTKLQAPAVRPGLVARPHLLARIEEGVRRGRRLTLVSAPPGFGKTTLIQAWIAGTARRVAWLSLDEGDNEPARFLAYIAAALDAPAAAEMAVLINAVADAGVETVLVLDDYHAVRDFAVHELVAFLVEHQPACLHLAIATREDPPLPLARARARDQLTEVRERDLRFSPAEAAGFLAGTMGLSLAPATVAALAARTEGWITGLQLVGLALQQVDAPDDFAAAFAGDDRYIVDYLMAEVLAQQPAALRDFLRQTSLLDRLCASLCNAVTGRDDGQAMLEHLEAANLFVVPLDNRRAWYRYHVLFAEVLRLSLPPAEQAEVHRRAAAWFQANGPAERALYHVRAAAELDAAGGERAGRPQPLLEPLSERELEVLRLIGQGYSNAEIGRKLYIAVGTVKRHINNIYGKLDVQSRTQAVATARALGLME